MSTAHIAVVPETHLDILQSTALAYVSILGLKGEPQCSPVWFGWDGHRLRFSHRVRQKARNLRRDPRIAVCIVDPADPYRYIELRGTATIEDDPDRSYIDVMAKKYVGVNRYGGDQPGDKRMVINVTPTHISTMTAGRLDPVVKTSELGVIS